MQSGAPDMSVRYGYLNACDDWRDAITPGAMTAFWGYLLEVEMKIKPRDDRPRLKFWAPGDYCSKCTDCGEYFTGDKRAITCADCAYGSKE